MTDLSRVGAARYGGYPGIVVGATVMATVSTIFPGFLVGALSVQISDEMGVSEAVYGWGLGSFFLAATVGSILLGRLAQRIGPANQMTAALAVTAVVQVALAATARSFPAVIGFLVIAGWANAANQTAVNLALARAELPRLGLAVSAKQSGMPAASLLAGFAVPALALTVGWRWAYVTGAALAVAAVPVVRAAIESAPTGSRARTPARPVSSFRALVLAAVAGGFLSFSAGTLNAWTVGSGVDAGLGPGPAGLFLGIGAGLGIALRLAGGYWSDTMRQPPFRVAGLTGLVGAASIAALALRAPGPHVAFTLLAFGGGWIWPAFTNFGIVRTNPDAAGTATGVTQMGIYVGVFLAPLVTGVLIEQSGYPLMWLATALSATIGSIIALRIADEF